MDDNIPVDDLVIVDEEEALTHLLHNLLDLVETELHIDVAEQTSQVVLAEVEHKIESALVPAVLPADHNEVDDVFKVEQLEDPDHPESIDKEAFLLIFDQNFHNLGYNKVLNIFNLSWIQLSHLKNLPQRSPVPSKQSSHTILFLAQ